jgi:DNA-binding IclR family transcriptional regulator
MLFVGSDIKIAILKAFHKFGDGLEGERLGLYKICEEVNLPEEELYLPISMLVEEGLLEPYGNGVEWYRLTFYGKQCALNQGWIGAIVGIQNLCN